MTNQSMLNRCAMRRGEPTRTGRLFPGLLSLVAAGAASMAAGHCAVVADTATSNPLAPVTMSRHADVVAAWGGNPILAGNLAQSGTMTLISGGDAGYGGRVANLNDGKMISGPDFNTIENTGANASFINGSEIKLLLDGTHDIARIDTITAYAGGGEPDSITTSSPPPTAGRHGRPRQWCP